MRPEDRPVRVSASPRRSSRRIPPALIRRVLAIAAVVTVLGACDAGPSVGPEAIASTPTPDAAGGSAGPSGDSSATDAVWTKSADMRRARDGFRVAVLGDGTVLAIGDDGCADEVGRPGSETAEVYDPAADAWADVGSLNKPRRDFAMAPMQDGGAMVVGGMNPDGLPYSSTKLYDVAARTWSDGPLLSIARGDPSAAAIGDGRIYVASIARELETGAVSTVEILVPGSDAWADGGTIGSEVGVERLVGLADGRILAVGWVFEISDWIEVHDSGGAEGWSSFERPDVNDIDDLVPLPDGDLLAFVRDESELGSIPSARVLRYDSATNAWADAAPMPRPRAEPQVTLLGDGRVLVAGGLVVDADQGEQIVASTDIYDPETDAWVAGPDLLEPRRAGHAVLLGDGSVLVLGGSNDPPVEGGCAAPLVTTERLRLAGG
jgi:hypothetical protein